MNTEAALGGADPYAKIALELVQQGWTITDAFLPSVLTRQLAYSCRQQWQQGRFHLAGVGHGRGHAVDTEIRNDDVMWLDPGTAVTAQREYLDRMERLRLALNQELQLGLFDFECMQAVYPPGSFYRRHLDQFRGIGLRTVTVITYLNEDWQREEGGQLRFYLEQGEDRHIDIEPAGGRLVCFLSSEFEHEVLPARRERLSLTGWFKRRDPNQLY